MFSVHNSELSGPGYSLDLGHCVVFLVRHFTLTGPLSTCVFKCILANLMLGVTLRWTSIQSRGKRNVNVIVDLQLHRSGTTQVPCSCH